MTALGLFGWFFQWLIKILFLLFVFLCFFRFKVTNRLNRIILREKDIKYIDKFILYIRLNKTIRFEMTEN